MYHARYGDLVPTLPTESGIGAIRAGAAEIRCIWVHNQDSGFDTSNPYHVHAICRGMTGHARRTMPGRAANRNQESGV